MARLSDIVEPMRTRIAELDCPTFDTEPWVTGPPLSERRIAMVSSAGLLRRGDKGFRAGADDYREIGDDVADRDILMSHISVNYDRTGFQQDLNLVLPRQLMHELAEAGTIGSVASAHYAFMGATDPREMEPSAHELANKLKADNVDSVVLIPV